LGNPASQEPTPFQFHILENPRFHKNGRVHPLLLFLFSGLGGSIRLFSHFVCDPLCEFCLVFFCFFLDVDECDSVISFGSPSFRVSRQRGAFPTAPRLLPPFRAAKLSSLSDLRRYCGSVLRPISVLVPLGLGIS